MTGCSRRALSIGPFEVTRSRGGTRQLGERLLVLVLQCFIFTIVRGVGRSSSEASICFRLQKRLLNRADMLVSTWRWCRCAHECCSRRSTRVAGGEIGLGAISKAVRLSKSPADLLSGELLDDLHRCGAQGTEPFNRRFGGIEGERSRGLSLRSCRQSVTITARLRLVRNPKWRMRTNVRDSTSRRKRRRNSSELTVIVHFLLPQA